MALLDLPVELLLLIPNFLHNIEDFTNLSSTCRTLRGTLESTSSNAILSLAASSSRTFFRPDPHYLIAATVRQVSDWALLNNDNTEILRQAFQGGVDTLFNLCLSKAGLTMSDIRRLHSTRFTTINPVTDMIDKCAGAQWYDTPNYWYGGVSDPETIGFDPPRSKFQIVIYGELFSTTMKAAHEPGLALPRFDLDTRLDYVKYCIPDPMCYSGYRGMKPLAVGPYASGDRNIISQIEDDQVRLYHILNCRTWREAWEAVWHQIGPDFDEQWRQQMWESAVQMQGLEGLEMLRPGGVEKWRSRLVEMRREIEELDERFKPEVHKFGSQEHETSDAPNLAADIYVTVSGYWGPFNEPESGWAREEANDKLRLLI